MPLLYAVPAIRVGPDVRTLVANVAAVTAIEEGNDHLGGRHGARPGRAHGPAIRHVRAARPGRVGPVPGRARPHTFRAEASQLREGEGLPRFVDDEFDAFLGCGWHAGGFARFRCTSCRAERLVAFSCKGGGFPRVAGVG